MPPAATWGSIRGGREAGEEGKRGSEPSLWLLQEGAGAAGEASLGLASLKDFSRFWN